MRPCEAEYYKAGKLIPIKGWFHQWGIDYEEYETGPAMYTMAIVEADDGKVYVCSAGTVKFLDKEVQHG